MPVKIKVKELRKATPYTQRQVADLLGITESNYRKLENSRIKSISLDTIDFLCTFFKCSPNDIFEAIE
jgi:DNA-binding Xre family transcriptional regulator